METSSQQKDNYFYDIRDEYLTNENLGQTMGINVWEWGIQSCENMNITYVKKQHKEKWVADTLLQILYNALNLCWSK